jgi:hypothetical protein
MRDDPGERRLSGSGRPEEDHRPDAILGDRPLQSAALTDDVPLAGELLQRLRAHPLGERGEGVEAAAGRVREEVICHGCSLYWECEHGGG